MEYQDTIVFTHESWFGGKLREFRAALWLSCRELLDCLQGLFRVGSASFPSVARHSCRVSFIIGRQTGCYTEQVDIQA